MLNSQVHERKMTEEERLAYLEKHPIKKTKRESFPRRPDYKWRSVDATKASRKRWGNKN